MILGIDIGGTSTKLGLVQNGTITARGRMATVGHADEHAFAEALLAEAEKLCAEAGLGALRSAVTAIGIGAPNGNQRTGTIDQAPNLPWAGDVPLAEMLRKRTGLPTALGNDANAAALGEWMYGCGQGCSDLLVVTLGTGLGSGFIVNGQLLLGPWGNAGELGHCNVVIDGRDCTCGRKGCLEAYVSIRGMRRTYSEHADGLELLRTEGVMPIAEAAGNGDDAARQTFISTARWLAVGLANAVAITTPRKVVLCGGIAASGELLMRPLRERFEAALLHLYRGKVELVVSALPSDDAGILGAAALVGRSIPS